MVTVKRMISVATKPDAPQDDARPGPPPSGQAMRLVLVTGVSGAGKSSTLAALADCGFETVDNPPIRLLHSIMDDFAASGTRAARVAIGVDERTHGFTTERFSDLTAELRERRDLDVALLFLDCSTNTLIRRFTETRRRHPMAGETVEASLAMERAVIEPLREQADVTIDTSDLSLTELRREVQERFGGEDSEGMSITILSFGFKRGAPREADIMFDVRFLANPYWNPQLRSGTGLDADVDAYVTTSEGFASVFASLSALLREVIPQYRKEGKSYLTVAIGCTGGRHRSVAVAERLGTMLRAAGHMPAVRHRDITRAGSARTRTMALTGTVKA